MGLSTYWKKRNFGKTPEPKGQAVASDPARLEFVVQRHAARVLHYDFRLEHNGVLLSWSVPKGPSLSPADRRLAVRTEDHPVSYAAFEGVIPKGEYGGGTIQLWDKGYWRPLADAEAGLKQGRLSFELFGERLHGAFTLVRMPGQKPESWLLMKSPDAYAQEDGEPVVDRYPTSVVSDRSVEAIASGDSGKKKAADKPASQNKTRPKKPPAGLRKAAGVPGAVKGRVPWPLSPQLPTLVDKPVVGEQWLHELKLDGYRLLARFHDDKVALLTRSGQDWTERLADVAEVMLNAFSVHDAVIDGELVAFDAQGRSAFNKLQVALRVKQRRLYFMAFDLLQLNGEDLRQVPLIERKALLQTLIDPAQDRVRFSDHVIAQGLEVLNQACRLETEGVVSKRLDAPYREGRNRDWVKVKCTGREEFVVGGFVTRDGNPMASLLLGRPAPRSAAAGSDEAAHLSYIGRVGTGFTREGSAELIARLKALEAERSPFTEKKLPTYAGDTLHWVRPELLVEVKFAGWTDQGILRHAVYLGIREDKPAQPVAPPPDFSNIRISNPRKVLYPEAGLTKGELAAWTALMSPWILPHVAGRPLMLLRCPAGYKGHCFFQKHHENLPSSVQAIKLPGDSEPGIAIEDAEGLLGLVQMGALEIHPWGARGDKPELPDRIVFDLDPDPDVPFATLVEAAAEVGDFLAEIGLKSWLRWSGGKGFHVVVPIARRHSWAEVKAFAKGAALTLSKQNPKRYVAVASKAKRKNKIFIDWLRNGQGATAIASWCVRAREGAPVATPLLWSDLHKDMDLTERRVPLVQPPAADPWRGFFEIEQVIPERLLNPQN